MIREFNNNINWRQCLKQDCVTLNSAAEKTIPNVKYANRVLLQFFDPADITTTKAVASIAENGETPDANVTSGTKGLVLFNNAMFEVQGIKNLKLCRFRRVAGLSATIKVRISYYQ